MTRRRTALCAAAVVAVVVAGGCVAYTGGARPLDPAGLAGDPAWIVAGATPAIVQHSDLDCGAAALAMVAGRWSVAWTAAEVTAWLPQPSQRGSRLGDLRDLARARGLEAYAVAGDRATLLHELRAGRPVVVGLWLRYGGRRVRSHYEVVMAIHAAARQVATLDPAGGWRIRTWDALEAEWGPAGRPTLIVLGRHGAGAP